jgi:hypothetical protein
MATPRSHFRSEDVKASVSCSRHALSQVGAPGLLAGVDHNPTLCGSIFDRGMRFIPFSHIIAILPVDRLTEALEEVASLSVVQAQHEPEASGSS